MNPEETNQDMSINLVQCVLHAHGCTDLFPQNEISKHYLSEKHLESIIKLICLQKLNHESALIDLAIYPIEAGTFSNNYLRFVERLNHLMIDTVLPPNPTDAISNDVPNINQTYNSIHLLSRNAIQQMDRASNHGLNLQAYQQQGQLNEMAMGCLSNRLTDLSSNGNHVNHHTEQDQTPPSANVQNAGVFYSNSILQIQLDEMPVSTDGNLFWPIDEIFNKITDAINRKKPYIDSRLFQTSMHGHRLRARLYFNGKSDPKFISFHIHLHFPVYNTFRANIKFVLVDQNKNYPLQHFIKICSGEMNDVNNFLGFDDFMDKNMLHQEGNPYVLNDSVYFLVCVEQTNQEKYANLPANVQDALMVIQQM